LITFAYQRLRRQMKNYVWLRAPDQIGQSGYVTNIGKTGIAESTDISLDEKIR